MSFRPVITELDRNKVLALQCGEAVSGELGNNEAPGWRIYRYKKSYVYMEAGYITLQDGSTCLAAEIDEENIAKMLDGIKFTFTTIKKVETL